MKAWTRRWPAGNYGGDTDTSDARAGEWQPSTLILVTPVPNIPAVPEPRHYAAVLGGAVCVGGLFAAPDQLEFSSVSKIRGSADGTCPYFIWAGTSA